MAQRITDSFGLAASIWNGDKFLMEAATSGGSRQIKVTAEVVGAYLSGSGGTPGTVIAETIPIEDIDALTAQEQAARVSASPAVTVQGLSVCASPTAVFSAATVADTPQAAVVTDLTKRAALVEDFTKRRLSVTDLTKRAALVEDFTKRQLSVTDLTKRAAHVYDLVRHAVRVDSITRSAKLCSPKARVVVVG